VSGSSLSVPRFSIGDQIADTYLVKRVIEGGMGTVYVCHHERWNIDLVVKAPREDILADPEHAHRVTREAEAWTDLGMHPHIAYCYYVYPLDGVPLLIIEYLDGGNLRDWITEGRCADLKAGLDLAIQFCHGLEHAHSQGLIHRDIKPENILLAQDGTLKITDFGIVRIGDAKGEAATLRALTSSAAGRTAGGIGTYEYMAPEQFVSAHEVDARADIFAFGVCLYEMFCGRRPYEIAAGSRQEPPEPREVRGDNTLPEGLCVLLKRCVDWDRERRPGNMVEIRKELCTIYEELFHQPSAFAELPDVSLEAGGWNNRGVTYLELQQEDKALECFEKALQANPTHLEATYNCSLLQWWRGDIDDPEVLVRMERLAGAPLVNTEELARAQTELHQELTSYFGRKEPPQDHPLRTLEAYSGSIESTAITPDGRRALSGHQTTPVKLWDLGTGKCLYTLLGHKDSVEAVALTSDGRRALSGSRDKTLKLWDLETGQCLRTLEDPDRVISIALTPDGRRALSGGGGGTLNLWDLETGQCLRTLPVASPVTSLAITPDALWALSGHGDGTMTHWRLIWSLEFPTL
jgi:serine/threonine protein kinase